MVRVKLILFFSLTLVLYAGQIEVSASHFYADEKKGQNVLSGNVIVRHEKDILRSAKLTILTNENRKPTRYIASGKACFDIVLNGKNYKGSGGELVYIVAQDTYEINGNAYIEELESGKKLFGDKIVANRKKNLYSITSKQNQPARFVFDLEEK